MCHTLQGRQLIHWPPLEDWYHPFKIWTFPQATKLQLLGYFWPAGQELHTPVLHDVFKARNIKCFEILTLYLRASCAVTY